VLGTDPDVDVDTLTVPAEPGDLFLLCSDGLTAMLRDDEILHVLEVSDGDPEQAARALVDAANQAGGDDNVTVVAFELVEGDEPPVDLTPATDETAEDVAVGGDEASTAVAPGADAPVTRHGAGKGGRLLALVAVLLALAAAILLLWWGISG
jgi:protein phosphatase